MEASTSQTQVKTSLSQNWLSDWNSPEHKARQEAWLVQRRQVGELWRVALSSVPLHAERAKLHKQETGDPLAYWINYGNQTPGSLPGAHLTESFTAEQMEMLEKLRLEISGAP